MKFAGFEAVVIKGASKEPCVLFIHDGAAEVWSMPELWGLTTRQTEEAIRSSFSKNDWRFLTIGPAGENLCRGACIICDGGRAAGRGGGRAVFGSKNLKAIAVNGTGSIPVAQPKDFFREVQNCRNRLMNCKTIEHYHEGGTHLVSGAGGYDGNRSQPMRNYRDEYWPPDLTVAIREPEFRKFEERRIACFNCPIYCGHLYRISSGPLDGVSTEGVHTNAVNGFGANLEIDRPEIIIAANSLCNDLGLDVDTVVACAAWAFEAYEKGAISTADTEGLRLEWGNGEALLVLLKQMAYYRQGFGAVLSDGVKRAAEIIGRGSDQYALHVKGADLNEMGMRWNKPWAFGIVTASRGGGHLDGAPQSGYQRLSREKAVEMFGIPTAGDVTKYIENAALVVWHEYFKAAIDALGIYYFTSYWTDSELLGPEDYARLFTLATGIEMDVNGLFLAGQRIQNIAKAFNTLHAGFTRKDDMPPSRLVNDPALSGSHRAEKIDLIQWNLMLDSYFEAHGWEISSGLQTKKILAGLNLQMIADNLVVRQR